MSESSTTTLTGTVVVSSVMTGSYIAEQSCSLVFEPGGMIDGLLHGLNARIIAPPIQIFGSNSVISGTFDVKCAYPEWWGAQATNSFSNQVDSSSAIQKALDSVFQTIQFCVGCYYIDEIPLLLSHYKTLQLSGLGAFTSPKATSGAMRTNPNAIAQKHCTTIWTDRNIPILKIRVADDETSNGIIVIEGGMFDVEKCVPSIEYNSPVILIEASNDWSLHFTSAIIGFNDTQNERNFTVSNGKVIITKALSIDYQPHVNVDLADLLQQDAWGTGIKIVDTENTTSDALLHNFKINSFISRLGQGLVVTSGHVTAMELGGVFYANFKPLTVTNCPFDGGKIESVFQAAALNGIDHIFYPFMDGDLSHAYVDAFIWDVAKNRPMFNSSSMDGVTFGQRYILNVRNKTPINLPLAKQLYTLAESNVHAIASKHDYRMLGLMGNMRRGDSFHGYIHVIDNDLLDFDSRYEDVTVNVSGNGYIHDISSEGSIFSTKGLQIYFSGFRLPRYRWIINVETHIPARHHVSNFALHLQGSAYNHFSKLQIKINGTILYNDIYADIPSVGDIIIPIYNPAIGTDLVLQISMRGYEPSEEHSVEPFTLALEGKMLAPEAYHLNSVSHAELNGTLETGSGAACMICAERFPTIADLPVNDSEVTRVLPGALAAVGPYRNFPVAFNGEEGKWFLMDFAGSQYELYALGSAIGPLSVGQEAFNTTDGKPVWWDGNRWRDYNGTEIRPPYSV